MLAGVRERDETEKDYPNEEGAYHIGSRKGERPLKNAIIKEYTVLYTFTHYQFVIFIFQL